MSRTMALHVRYKSLYISLPSSTKQQREMTDSAGCLKNVNYDGFFLKLYLKFIAVSQIQFRDSLDSDKQSKWLKSIPRFVR